MEERVEQLAKRFANIGSDLNQLSDGINNLKSSSSSSSSSQQTPSQQSSPVGQQSEQSITTIVVENPNAILHQSNFDREEPNDTLKNMEQLNNIEIALLGGTQGIGKQCLLFLLIKGVKVRVLARNPSMLSPLDSKYADQLTIIKGDATREKDVELLISNSVTQVICALGVRMNEPTKVVESGVTNAINSMKKLGKEMRFVLVTSSALVKANANWFFDNIVKKHLLNHIYDDLRRAEKALIQLTKDSNISYAIVRPPQLVDAPATLDIVISEGDDDYPAGGTHLVSREDVAALLIDCLFDKSFNQGNRTVNMDTTRKLDIKVDMSKVLKDVTPYPKYLMIRLAMFSVMAGVGSLAAFSLFKLKSLFFPQLEQQIVKYLSK